MSTPQNPFPGQFPLTAPDLAVASSPLNPSAGGMVDIDDLATETTSELQNLIQDLTSRMTEMPGSNLDFGSPNTRGIGIQGYIGASSVVLLGLPGRIDAEFELDSRVTSSATTIQKQVDGSYLITSQIACVAGVFGVTWSWSQLGIAPVQVATAA